VTSVCADLVTSGITTVHVSTRHHRGTTSRTAPAPFSTVTVCTWGRGQGPLRVVTSVALSTSPVSPCRTSHSSNKLVRIQPQSLAHCVVIVTVCINWQFVLVGYMHLLLDVLR